MGDAALTSALTSVGGRKKEPRGVAASEASMKLLVETASRVHGRASRHSLNKSNAI